MQLALSMFDPWFYDLVFPTRLYSMSQGCPSCFLTISRVLGQRQVLGECLLNE